MKTGQHAAAGFTLIEALVATMILGLVLSAVLAVSSQSMRHMNDIRLRLRSSEVLQREMENIRVMNWSQIQSLPGTFTDPTDTLGRYAGTISQSAYDSYSGTTTVVRITLTVTWTNQVHRVLTNSLSTLVGNSGLNNYVM